ncbi:MAG: adenylyl-sulfate kinase [Deltaproteobacteria bacterium]|nr:adenylyl-sulfate kinase [Deltaproteobacteria bacterium]
MRGLVVWLTGLPSSGKSTLAERLAARLRESRCPAIVLDGDSVRESLVPRPGYSSEERDQFYETLSNLAATLARQPIAVIVPATAHRRSFRERARERSPAFVEVLVDASLDEVQARDAKGLYAKSEEGSIAGLPGANLPYEPPERPDVVARGGLDERALDELTRLVLWRAMGGAP